MKYWVELESEAELREFTTWRELQRHAGPAFVTPPKQEGMWPAAAKPKSGEVRRMTSPKVVPTQYGAGQFDRLAHEQRVFERVNMGPSGIADMDSDPPPWEEAHTG